MSSSYIVLAIIALTFAFFFGWTFRFREKSWRFEGFYLGGRNIGSTLTREVFWGTSFSLANGIFYFAVLAYYNGLAVIWLQIPWMAAIWFLAWKLPTIISITDRYTIHGFLGKHFGSKAKKLASLITIFGFLGALAFEINVSSEIISSAIFGEVSFPYLVILSLLVALTAASYCDTGGFIGGAQTDRFQNYLGLLAIGIIFYAIFSGGLSTSGVEGFQSKLGANSIIGALFDFSEISLLAICGILVFASTFNIVDMSNWQVIAANSGTDKNNIKKLRKSMVVSTFLILLLPAAIGSFFGYLLRNTTLNGNPISDADILPILLQSIANTELGVIGMGIACAGLLATALSTSDSYLLSSSQAITWDLKGDLDTVVELDEKERAKFEEKSVRKARQYIYMLAIVSLIVFMVARYFLDDTTVFVFQFVIFGLVVALAPAVIWALRLEEQGHSINDVAKGLITASIALGFASGALVAIYSTFSDSFNAYAWAPIATISVSLLTALLGMRAAKKPKA